MVPRICPFKIKQIPVGRKTGKIIKHPEHPDKDDELVCAEILANFGDRVVFLPESSYRSFPDCKWRELEWEIKTLYGDSEDNVIHAIRAANSQSHNIIINATRTRRDLRQIGFDAMRAYKQIKSQRPNRILILNKKSYLLLLEDVLKY